MRYSCCLPARPDHQCVSPQVGAWRGFPSQAELVPRHAHQDRVDRLKWRVPASLEGYIDAHMPQPGFAPQHWPAVRPLLALLFTPLSGQASESRARNIPCTPRIFLHGKKSCLPGCHALFAKQAVCASKMLHGVRLLLLGLRLLSSASSVITL